MNSFRIIVQLETKMSEINETVQSAAPAEPEKPKIRMQGEEQKSIYAAPKTTKIDRFIKLMQPFGIVEIARTGAVAIQRDSTVE